MWTRKATARPRYAASAQIWMSAIKRENGDHAGATSGLDQAVAALRRIYGESNPGAAEALFERGLVHASRGDAVAAEADLRTAADLWDGIGQPEHIAAIRARAHLAGVLGDMGRIDEALEAAGKATDALIVRINRDSGERARSLSSELRSLRAAVITHVDLLHRRAEIARQAGASAQTWIADSFRVAQIARATSAAHALARVSARFAAGSSPLAELVRKRQNLSERWREIDERLSISILQAAEWRDAR